MNCEHCDTDDATIKEVQITEIPILSFFIDKTLPYRFNLCSICLKDLEEVKLMDYLIYDA